MEEIDQQPFDVGAVVILISHDHNRSIPQVFFRTSATSKRETQDLDNVHYFLVFHNLSLGHIPHVQRLTSQWENAIPVAANHSKASDGKRLGTVAFGKDESAMLGIGSASIVSILKLRYTQHTLR